MNLNQGSQCIIIPYQLSNSVRNKSIEDINNAYIEMFGFLNEKKLTQKEKISVHYDE